MREKIPMRTKILWTMSKDMDKLKEAEHAYQEATQLEVDAYNALAAAMSRYHDARQNAIQKLSQFNDAMKAYKK